MLGVLIRSTPGAIVAYFVYSLVLPTIFGVLAAFQDWFEDVQAVDRLQLRPDSVVRGRHDRGAVGPARCVSGMIWLVIPMAIGVWAVLRSEVK